MTDPFALKFYSAIQNNIGPTFGDRLNFVTCEHYLSLWCAIEASVFWNVKIRNQDVAPRDMFRKSNINQIKTIPVNHAQCGVTSTFWVSVSNGYGAN